MSIIHPPIFLSPPQFRGPLPPHTPSTVLFQETGLIALYWNCAAVQRLGGKQDRIPPPPQHFTQIAHFISFCPHTPFSCFLPPLYFLSKANTIIQRELPLYSCIKWNAFMLTSSFTCTLQSPNIPPSVHRMDSSFTDFSRLCNSLPASLCQTCHVSPIHPGMYDKLMHESCFEGTERSTPRWAWVSSPETHSFHTRSRDWALNIHEVEAINITAPHTTLPVHPQISSLRSKRKAGPLGHYTVGVHRQVSLEEKNQRFEVNWGRERKWNGPACQRGAIVCDGVEL